MSMLKITIIQMIISLMFAILILFMIKNFFETQKKVI